MSAAVSDLTRGSLPKQILLFSLPLMASNLLQVLFNLADIAVVGQFAGAAALGSVGSTTTLISMLTGFLIGVASGINVLVARHFGAGNLRELRRAVHSAALVSLLIGLIWMALGLVFAPGILSLLHTKPDLMDGAVLYLRIYLLGMPAMAVYNFGSAVFSAAGNTRKPLVYLSIAGVLNVVLNLFFVIVCRLSVAGVALASILSQYLSAVLIVLALLRSREAFSLRPAELKFSRQACSDVLRLGVPAGFQNAIFAIANLFIQTGVNSFSSTMVSGSAAAANADTIVYDVMAAFYTACASFMGQNYGARNRRRVLRSYFISLAYSFCAGLVLGLALVAFGRQFLGLFTREAEVIDAGMQRLVIMGFSYSLSAFMDNSISASRALGKTVIPTVIVISGSCVFRILWVYTVFAHFRTIPSLYLLYSASWTITAIAETAYFAHIYRRMVAQPQKPDL